MALTKFNLTVFLSLTLVGSALAQKIKYKDLFVLLNAKQYAEAEPFLRKYLKENQDNSNAFLNMGYIFEEKALASDVLKETDQLATQADSAILFFNKTLQSLDERELKKNDEYYQLFSRRDLRTGEFGLKLSDIQFELEKRIKALREKRTKALDAKSKFIALQKTYERNLSLFKSIADRYRDQREFYLRSNDALEADLRNLTRKYDSCLVWFNDYKAALQAIGKTGYNPELTPRDIDNFKKDGVSATDFLQDVIQVWDFKRWASQQLDVLENEVKPLADKLIKIDADLNALGEKIKKDSISVLPDVQVIWSRVKATGLEKFDTNPLPFDVFRLKISELEYGSSLANYKPLRDSADIAWQAALLVKLNKQLKAIDSLGMIAQKRDLEYETENYKAFVQTAYGSLNVLSETIKSTRDVAVSALSVNQKRLDRLNILKNWLIDASDSIPVMTEVKSSKFWPISILPNQYTVGFTYPDSSKVAYFYAISPSHKATLKATVKVDSAVFDKAKLPVLKSIVTADESKQNYYVVIYSEDKVRDKVPSIAFKVTSTGAAWSIFLYCDGLPMETIVTNTGDFTIKIAGTDGADARIIKILPDGKIGG